MQQKTLLDHLVGAQQKGFRDGQAEGLGRRQIDDELEFRRLLNWNGPKQRMIPDACYGCAGEICQIGIGRGSQSHGSLVAQKNHWFVMCVTYPGKRKCKLPRGKPLVVHPPSSCNGRWPTEGWHEGT